MPNMDRKAPTQSFAQLAVELGPAIVFMVSYNLARRYEAADGESQAIYWATGLFMAATAAALAFSLIVQKRAPLMLMVSGAIVMVFGALTIALHSPTFAYIKPTIINSLFAAALIGGLLVGRNLWKLLFQSAFSLPDRIWDVLAMRWAFFYAFLAILNEVIWRTQTEAFWANFKVLGVIPLTFGFLLLNLPITFKWWDKSNADYEAARAGAGDKPARAPEST